MSFCTRTSFKIGLCSIFLSRADLQMTFLDLGVLTVLKVGMKVLHYISKKKKTSGKQIYTETRFFDA